MIFYFFLFSQHYSIEILCLKPLLARFGSSGVPLTVTMNKVDAVRPKDRLLGVLAAAAELFPGAELIPVSAPFGGKP